MTEILQATPGPSVEQRSNYFELNFADLTDANGAALSFSGYTAEIQVFPLYSKTPVFTIGNADITISADDISVSYDTSGVETYTPGEYRYSLNLTVGGKKYERVYGRVFKY